MSDKRNEKPGEGLRSLRSTTAFRVINFELYAKPVSLLRNRLKREKKNAFGY